MVTLKVRYLHKIKRQWYWVPSAGAKSLGFKSLALGKDLNEASRKAQEINTRLDAERKRANLPTEEVATIAVLISKYLSSPSFIDLAPKTQKDYRNILERFREKAGQTVVALITRAECVDMYDGLRKRHGESMASSMMRVWRLLLGFAYDSGWRSDNPARGMRIKGTAARTAVWSPEQVSAFVEAANADGEPALGLAVELAYDIGQRQGDVLRLTWTEFDGQGFTLRQSKTGASVYAALTPAMAARLSAMERRAVQVIVCRGTQKPYQPDFFRHEFARIRALAELPETLQFRDLRRTALTEMGAGGATDTELRAMSGHSSSNVLRVYVRPSSTEAREAQQKRVAKKSDAKQP
jgi:integrase